MGAEAPHLEFSRQHVMIMCAPNGARRMPSDHPNLPITPEDIARAAAPLPDAGVSVLHLHVRDRQGGHTLDTQCYRDAINAVRKEVGDRLIIQATSESVGQYGPEEQMAMVKELRPEAVSLALREICADASAESTVAQFNHWLGQNAIWPQYILYSAEDLVRFERLRKDGFFATDHPSCLLVLGRYAGQVEGRPEQLDELLGTVNPENFSWAACCFGPQEYATMVRAVDLGGHVRIGFENNLWLADGTPASDNQQLIAQFVAHLGNHSRSPATADQVRALLAAA